MAAPKNPESYPAAFQMLLERFRHADAEPVVTRYARVSQAASVRFTFYSFKKALAARGREEDLRIANGIMIKLIDQPGGGAVLEFSLRDNIAWALDLEAALAEVQSTAGAPPQRGQEVQHAEPAPALTSDEAVDKYLKR